ncbi:MAG: GTPase HflX [Alphaproteobacteria bacterium]|nr:GTPase HflX [Alphaproteobacteria bacterium]
MYPYSRQRLNGQRRQPESQLDEAVGLAEAIDLTVAHREAVGLSRIIPSSYLGRGVVERFHDLISALEVDVVVIDAMLSPVQQRNLERQLAAKVIDRTGLILEIFGARARTHEGRLQVELAALDYQRSRLVRSWTHLERQRGGFGFLGGPGERQLEMDRRLIGDRIAHIRRELETVKRTRSLHRAARRRVPYPIVSLVGYTNAGKSTLFNRLTDADVFAEDQLFATLDPTMRAVDIPSGHRIVLSDTVGFISQLPTHLVAAFRATLEEVAEADVIVHVRDISHPESDAQKADVLEVLAEMGLGDDRRIVEVMNKTDLLEPDEKEILAEKLARDRDAVAVSAITGEGCADLLALLSKILSEGRFCHRFQLDVSDGAALAWLYAHGHVVDRQECERHVTVEVSLEPADAARFERRFSAKSL